MSPWHELTATLPADASAPRRARAAIAERLDEGVGAPRATDLKLAASELVAAAVMHSRADGSGSLDLRLLMDGPRARIEVVVPGAAWSGDASTGLALIERVLEHLCRRWGVDADASTIWAEI